MRNVYIKMALVTNHMSQVKGFVNINPDHTGLAGAIISIPDSMYGAVKSTYSSRSAVIVTSPMAAS